MTIATIREGLAERLRTIDGLTVYEYVPAGQIEPPCATIDLEGTEYQQVAGGGLAAHLFSVYVTVPRGGGLEEGQGELDPYIDRSGGQSVWSAVNGDGTLGGACERAWVRENPDYGLQSIGEGADAGTYLGARFEVEVWA